MKQLKLYYIQNNYIEYLRNYDNRIPYNKNLTRPYIGIVYTYKEINYFAPLSSPKTKHKRIKDNAVDVFKLDKGNLGVININNMIPVPKEVLTEVLPLVTDEKYKILLENQLTFINNHKSKLYSKVLQFQSRYRKGFLSNNILNRCNINLLEEKYIQYIEKNYNI